MEKAVCNEDVDEWVGGWVGGWKTYRSCRGRARRRSSKLRGPRVWRRRRTVWGGGWVGGWVGRWKKLPISLIYPPTHNIQTVFSPSTQPTYLPSEVKSSIDPFPSNRRLFHLPLPGPYSRFLHTAELNGCCPAALPLRPIPPPPTLPIPARPPREEEEEDAARREEEEEEEEEVVRRDPPRVGFSSSSSSSPSSDS